jgi:hypothetical protein
MTTKKNNTPSIEKKDLPKDEQRNVLQSFFANSLRSVIGNAAKERYEVLQPAIEKLTDVFFEVLPEFKDEDKIANNLQNTFQEAFELFGAYGYGYHDFKSSFWHIGLPFELRSTEKGRRFIKDLENGVFTDDDGRFCKEMMSDDEIELNRLYQEHKIETKARMVRAKVL